MSEETKPRRRLAEFAVLGVAVAIAIGVGAYLLIGGDDNKSSSGPAVSAPAVVTSLYAAVGKDDAAAFNALLDPDLRESPTRALIAFPRTLGSYNVGDGQAPKIASLVVQQLNDQAGWASVGVAGQLTLGTVSQPFDETVYLRDANGQWLVSTEADFLKAFSGSPTAASASDLGPLGPQRPEEGKPAPDFALLDVRDGTTVRKLSDYKGKAVILNFFASWCGPCKAEIPAFQAAYTAQGNNLVVLGVDFQEPGDKARGILESLKAQYPAVLDTEGSVSDQYRASVLPSTFFIDKDGVVQAIKYGQVHDDELADLLAKIGITQ